MTTATTKPIIDSHVEVLASMMVENTGRHFLDSGGAYGRNWERNRAAVKASGMTAAEHFLATPDAWVDGYNDDVWPVVSTFHYLRDRVARTDTAVRVEHAFRMWVYMQPRDTYWSDKRYTNSWGTLHEFLQLGAERGWFDLDECYGEYTYNEDNCLSQDFQYQTFRVPAGSVFGNEWAEKLVFISLHNGCDARGGFTDWRAFEVDCEYFGCDVGDAYIHWECDAPFDPNQLSLEGVDAPERCWGVTQDFSSGRAEWYVARDGRNLHDPPELLVDLSDDPEAPLGGVRRCPCGRGRLTISGASAPYA